MKKCWLFFALVLTFAVVCGHAATAALESVSLQAGNTDILRCPLSSDGLAFFAFSWDSSNTSVVTVSAFEGGVAAAAATFTA